MEFYTVTEVSKLIGLKPKTITKLIRENKLTAYKIGKAYKIKPIDLNVYLENCKKGVKNG